MGVDWTAMSIIGVMIKKNDTKVSESVRGCEHPKRNGNFCPECGKKMWVSSSYTRKEIENLENSKVFTTIHSTDDEELFVGVLSVSTDSNRRGGELFNKVDLSDVIDVKDIKQRLQIVLGDLYKESNFGLWSVLHCSY